MVGIEALSGYALVKPATFGEMRRCGIVPSERPWNECDARGTCVYPNKHLWRVCDGGPGPFAPGDFLVSHEGPGGPTPHCRQRTEWPDDESLEFSLPVCGMLILDLQLAESVIRLRAYDGER